MISKKDIQTKMTELLMINKSEEIVALKALIESTSDIDLPKQLEKFLQTRANNNHSNKDLSSRQKSEKVSKLILSVAAYVGQEGNKKSPSNVPFFNNQVFSLEVLVNRFFNDLKDLTKELCTIDIFFLKDLRQRIDKALKIVTSKEPFLQRIIDLGLSAQAATEVLDSYKLARFDYEITDQQWDALTKIWYEYRAHRNIIIVYNYQSLGALVDQCIVMVSTKEVNQFIAITQEYVYEILKQGLRLCSVAGLSQLHTNLVTQIPELAETDFPLSLIMYVKQELIYEEINNKIAKPMNCITDFKPM